MIDKGVIISLGHFNTNCFGRVKHCLNGNNKFPRRRVNVIYTFMEYGNMRSDLDLYGQLNV